MGNLLSRYIQGDYSGNTGDNNIFGSSITNNYYNRGDRNRPENYENILQKLYPPGSGYKSHRNRVPKPVEGTCAWVTDHRKYREWLENKTSGLLWLSADPGCGKSVIARFLVGQLETQTDAIVCYFFFKDDSEEQKNATFALRALLHQLFVKRPNLCSYAEEAFKTQDSRFVEEVDTLWDILIKATTEGGCGDVICVVDALDECEKETITPLIHHITSIRESQPAGIFIPLKFFVTSRPYHRIEVELGSPTTTIRLRGEDEVTAITADVSRVIDQGIKKLESHWGRAGGLEYLRDLLVSSADRTFLWVSLVLEILKGCEDDSPEEFTNIVTTAPRDLAQFYTKMLDKSANPDKARRILNIVIAAARPLTLREMHIAFRIKRDHTTMNDLGDFSTAFEKTIKNLCGLFVRVIDEKIYLVHQTAREFLIKGSSTGQGNWQYTLCSMHSNFIMTDICISYLSLEDFETDPLPENTNRLFFSRGQIDYVREHVLLDYAATHWPDHFRNSLDRQLELFELTRRICDRGSKRCLTWFRVFWQNDLGPRGHFYGSPNDFTHLMMASWLGHDVAVKVMLEEGGDLNAKSEIYGTALNVAALRKQEDIAKMLLERNVIAYILGKNVSIINTKRSELEGLLKAAQAVSDDNQSTFSGEGNDDRIIECCSKKKKDKQNCNLKDEYGENNLE